jgi:3-oxoacyl-[acyl-carrier-protein] synthase II
MLAGGVESLKDPDGVIMRGFDVLGTLTQASDGRPKPFTQNHDGFLFAEGGAGVLVLEELEHAKKRGAPIYAEVLRYHENCDAKSIVQIDKSGTYIHKLLEELCGEENVDYINSHGSGTVLNDTVESEVINRVFGAKDRQPLINATKGLIGHTIGASGAIEAITTLLSMKHSRIHGNYGEGVLGSLNVAINNPVISIKKAVSTSYGFGGHNAGLLFGAYSG